MRVKLVVSALLLYAILVAIGLAVANHSIGIYDTRIDKLSVTTCYNSGRHGSDDAASGLLVDKSNEQSIIWMQGLPSNCIRTIWTISFHRPY